MADLPALLEQLESLRTAYRTGTTSINYDGKSVVYRDLRGMQAAIISLESEIAKATGESTPRNYYPRSTGWS